jgi:putative aldouronate transport system substrate-binding protein
MQHKWLSAAAVLGVGSLLLTGCSASTPEDAELTSLSIMGTYFSPTPPEADDQIETALSELTGVDINMRWSPNADYNAQTNVVLAGDDVPDVMVVQGKTQGFIQTAEAGGFWDLTEYIKSGDYPNLVPSDPAIQEAASVNGKVYGVYRARDLVRYVVILRADWLKNLGLETPKTTEELMKVAQAFSEKDPDGNGADDTYGLMNNTWSGIGKNTPLDAIEVWHGAGNVWRDDDGELVPTWLTDEWRESLDYSKEMFAKGWMNPDFPTTDLTKVNEQFLTGKAGMLIGVSSWTSELYAQAKQINPENADNLIALAGQPAGPNGDFALPTAGYSGFLAIPKAKVNSEAKLKQVLKVLNEMNSAEGQRLLNNGIEGVNYTVQDGAAKYDPAQQELTSSVQLAWLQLNTSVNGVQYYPKLPASDYEAELTDTIKKLAAEDLEKIELNPAAGLVSPTYITNASQLDQIISDARMQYIVGALDEAGLDAAIEKWRQSGGDKVIAEFNELYKPAN